MTNPGTKTCLSISIVAPLRNEKTMYVKPVILVSIAALLGGCAELDMPTAETPHYPVSQRYYVVAVSLNMRECAGTDCRIVSVLHRGDSGRVIAQQGNWVSLELIEKARTGWVAGRYLSSEPVEKTPVAQSREIEASPPQAPTEDLAETVPPPSLPDEELATPESRPEQGAPPALSEELASPGGGQANTAPAPPQEELAQ